MRYIVELMSIPKEVRNPDGGKQRLKYSVFDLKSNEVVAYVKDFETLDSLTKERHGDATK